MKRGVILFFVFAVFIMSVSTCFASSDMICAEGKLEGDPINLDVLYDKLGGGNYNNFLNWSNHPIYCCGKYCMIGGYGHFGSGASTQMTIDLPPGKYVIYFNYYAGDSWDLEEGRLYVNDQLVWSKKFGHGGSDLCGGSWGDSNNIPGPIYNATFEHSGGPVTIKFTSTLNEGSTNEWWGINNVVIKSLDNSKIYYNLSIPNSWSVASTQKPVKRGPDYVEFYYYPTYNYGPFDRVRWNCGPFRVRVYYDNTIQLCSLTKMDTKNSLSAGGCSAALLLYPNMNGGWNALSDKTYLQQRLMDVAHDVIYESADYNVLVTNSYVTGFGDKYLSIISARGRDGKFSLKCNLENRSYFIKETVSGSTVDGDPGDHLDFVLGDKVVFSDDGKNWNDASINTLFIPKGYDNIILNYYFGTCHDCCCWKPTYLYLGGTLFESDKGFLGDCTVTDSGMSWNKYNWFASGYGTGRAIKRVSSEMIIPGKSINITLYVDPPRAEYVKIKDYIPKEFNFNGKVTIERRKLGDPNSENVSTITVTKTLEGNDWAFELNGENYDILKNLAWDEYIEIKYTINLPTTLTADTYTLKGADVTYAPQI
jgi:hypothetical protein